MRRKQKRDKQYKVVVNFNYGSGDLGYAAYFIHASDEDDAAEIVANVHGFNFVEIIGYSE